MKPDAWMDSNGVSYTNKVSAEYYGCSTPLYSIATIHKWLEQEPSDKVMAAGDRLLHMSMHGSRTDMNKAVFRAMLAVKLAELEQRGA